MKKTLAFFACSNGYGHFKRITEIANRLSDSFLIDIYCEKYQFDKIRPSVHANYIFYEKENVRWDKALADGTTELQNTFDTYKKWIDSNSEVIKSYDYVISDNLPGLLYYRDDIILMGSFLWKDVFEEKFGDNKLSDFDNQLIKKYKPIIITNKYVETGSLLEYKHKRQFGFGCDRLTKINYWDHATNIVVVEPSLNYLPEYSKCINQIKQNYENSEAFTVHTKPNLTQKCIYIIRPGVGMLTHCVEHNIPICALYSEDDSEEIISLAYKIEDLGIGCIQNTANFNELTTTYFHDYKIRKLQNNNIYNKVELEKNGYTKISHYLKSLML